MPAVWTITGIHDADATDTSSSRRELTATAALAFGGGSRSSPILTAIQKDVANMSLHIGDAAVSGASDTCPAPHLHVMTYSATANSCYSDGTFQTITNASPPAAKGIEFRFAFSDTPVEITQCQLWAGTSAAVIGLVGSAAIYFCERNNSGANSGKDAWSASWTSSPLALHPFSTAANTRDWYVAMSIVASAVGFTNSNKIKIEATYQ